MYFLLLFITFITMKKKIINKNTDQCQYKIIIVN